MSDNVEKELTLSNGDVGYMHITAMGAGGVMQFVLQDNDPAFVLGGRDQQLENAVLVALQKIKERPWQFPPVPPYPKR